MSAPPSPAPASAAASGLDSAAFTTLLALQFVFGIAFSTFLMFPKILAAHLGAGPRGIAAVSTMFALGGIAAVALIGARIERPGRPGLMARGSLLMAFSSLGYLFVHGVGPLALGLRGVQGFAYTVVFVAGAALAADLSPPERMGRTMGLYGSSNLITNALAPAIAEPLLDHFGTTSVYALAALASFASFALSRRLTEPARAQTAAPGASLADVLRRGRARRTVAIVALTGIALGTVFNFYQPMALALGLRTMRVFFIAYTAAVLFVRFGLGNVVDRVGPQRATVGALVLYTLVVFSMRFLGDVGLAPLGAAFGVAHGFFFPAVMSLSVAELPSAERGRMFALANGGFVGGTGLVLPLGDVAARAGYPTVFALGAACTLAALALLVSRPIAGPRAFP